MRFLIISTLFVSLSLVSCGRRFDNVKKRNAKGGKSTSLQVVQNEVSVDIFQKFSFNTVVRRGHKRKIQPICRGINGCLRVCKHFDSPKCKQLSADKVVSFWLNKIGTYKSWEQVINDLKLIATKPDVSVFLKNMDQNNRVVQALFRLNTSADCPMNKAGNILFSHSPSPSLYLKSPAAAVASVTEDGSTPLPQSPLSAADNAAAGGQPEEVDEPDDESDDEKDEPDPDKQEEAAVQAKGPTTGEEESNKKKIIDGSVILFDLQVFVGFIKKCFGYKSRTFSEMAAQTENKEAFEIGHAVLSQACNGNSECVRLAYCEIGSDLVWNNLQESVKEPGCDYDKFVEMLP